MVGGVAAGQADFIVFVFRKKQTEIDRHGGRQENIQRGWREDRQSPQEQTAETHWQAQRRRRSDKALRKTHMHRDRQQTGCSFHGSFCKGSGEGNGLSADGIFIMSGSGLRYPVTAEKRQDGFDTSGPRRRSPRQSGRAATGGLRVRRQRWRLCHQPVTRHPRSPVRLPARDCGMAPANEYKTALRGLQAVEQKPDMKLVECCTWFQFFFFLVDARLQSCGHCFLSAGFAVSWSVCTNAASAIETTKMTH